MAFRDDLALALELADLADRISMRLFNSPALAQDLKADGSIVTAADIEIETALRCELERARPADAILGEEYGGTVEGNRVWMLDSVDGTAAFVGNNTDWSTLISLVQEGEPVVGVCSRPATGRRWWAARGAGAFADGRPIRVSDTATLAGAVMCEDFRLSVARQLMWNPLPLLAGQCARLVPWSDRASAFFPIAEGRADFLVNWWGGKGPDLTSGICVLSEAGGRFSDLRGRLDIDADIQVMSNGALHDLLLDTVNEMIATMGFNADHEPVEDIPAIIEARKNQDTAHGRQPGLSAR
jgi:histidinol-phosphatase